MKATLVSEPGGPERLVFADVSEPTVGSTDLLVEISAAGLNYIDTYHRSGLYPMEFPFTPGLEGAGTVLAVGSDVTDFSVGDRVGWFGAIGSYSEQHSIPAPAAVPIPDDVDDRVAAAVLLQGLTAHYLALDTFPLGVGDTCLIHAGAGGVGLLLTQVAKMRGAMVITTVGTHDKAELSKEAGADEVIVYTETGFKAAVEALVGEKRLDVVYDGVGKATFDDGLDLLRPRGMMVTFGNASGPVPPVAPLLLSTKGSLFLTRPTMAHYLRTREEVLGRVNELFRWITEGRLVVRIGSEFPLAEAAAAHHALEARETSGKVLLLP